MVCIGAHAHGVTLQLLQSEAAMRQAVARAARPSWRRPVRASLHPLQTVLTWRQRRVEFSGSPRAAQAKQGKMDELTPGQAAQLARNEEVIDRTAEELEELEEALSESVAESLRGRRQQAEQQPARKKKRCGLWPGWARRVARVRMHAPQHWRSCGCERMAVETGHS